MRRELSLPLLALAAALLPGFVDPAPEAVRGPEPAAHAVAPHAEVTVPIAPQLTAASAPPRHVWSDRSDVRAITAHEGTLWVATGGGLVRVGLADRRPRVLGTATGLDTLDVRRVQVAHGKMVVETAFSTCDADGERFTCRPVLATAPLPHEIDSWKGRAVTARFTNEDGVYLGTRGSGLWFLPRGGTAMQLTAGAEWATGSFVRAAVVSRGALWLGTFRDGLQRVALNARGDLPEGAKPTEVPSPFRMVNELAEVDGAIFVAANEGLFVSRSGSAFERVPAIGARSITGVAADGSHLWVTSTEALYRLDRAARHKVEAAYVHPAGSRSIQGLAVAPAGVWLATEDRGAVWFDGSLFHARDRLAGLPTSWATAITIDPAGGAFVATLRDGALHVTPTSFERVPAAGMWGQRAAMVRGAPCFGTQEGASCGTTRFSGLPDPRVHLVQRVGQATLVATEAGLALYGPADEST